MGYRIVYNPETESKYPMMKQKPNMRKWPVLVLAASVLLITLVKPELREKAAEWILPGDPEVTKAAFNLMLDEIRSGDEISDAVTAFCKEIMGHEQETAIHYT